ncbi:hypothetical protein [Cohnella cholangitidis]|uniref:Uncharacterized protein n=1 Tax=Cohnella cholangitidis TaxID=2598458 RepID=A0A7G5C5I8_9BACL|nr:hypothetical protein [Cohnella cholangitidis]QMV44472.1 hypothetical protein FPL14_27360 [Cohnella cholangitidis]
MYPISPLYADYLRRKDREFLVKAVIAGTEYSNRVIVDFEIENSLALGEEFEIGTAILSKLTIKLRTNDVIPPNAKVVPYLALAMNNIAWQDANFAWQDADFPWVGGSTSWLPLGEFYVDSREKVNDVWVFTCLDKLVFADVPYISSLTYPTTQQAVWNEICTRLGYVSDSSVVINPAYQIQAGPAGYSYRQVMGYIASANSASVFAGKDGKIKFKRFTASETPVFEVTRTDYVRAVQTNPIKTYTRVVVTYNTEDGLTYEAGTGDENHTLYVENPFATQAITNNLLATLNGISYLPISMNAMGYPQLEHGDCIGFTVDEGLTWENATIPWQDMNVPWSGLVQYKTFILHKVYSFKGGLRMTLEAPSKSEQKSEFVVEGTLSQQVNRLNNNAVKQGKSYYGATITRTAGLTIEREDHASKAVFNSDELTFYKGSTKALWFDVPTSTYKFTGVIEASSFRGGDIAIGSGNNIFKADSNGIWAGHANFASAPFSVNMSGHMKAVGGEFSGDITASIITGGQINGSTITGSLIQTAQAGVFPRSEMSVSGAYFGAYAAANKYIMMSPYFYQGSGVVLSFKDGSYETTVYQDGQLFVIGGTDVQIGGDVSIGSELLVNDANAIRLGPWTTLGDELAGKATSGISTGLSGGHNHGISDTEYIQLYNSAGTPTRLHKWVAAAQHSHAQV